MKTIIFTLFVVFSTFAISSRAFCDARDYWDDDDVISKDTERKREIRNAIQADKERSIERKGHEGYLTPRYSIYTYTCRKCGRIIQSKNMNGVKCCGSLAIRDLKEGTKVIY